MSALKSVRKYLSLLSTFFVLLAAAHLAVVYLFLWSKTVPESGGAVSVGFVGSVPSLSPVQFRKDPAGDFMLRFLYRSLLRYDLATRTMQGDLANCDLGRNLKEIRCFFKEGSKWSDGTPITADDVVATYALFSETDSNKKLQSSLSKTVVESQGNELVFKTANPNIDLLDVFTLPIMSQKMVEAAKAGKVSDSDAAYSGPFVFEKLDSDDRWVQKISVVPNPHSDKPHLVSKFVFKFFADAEALNGAKDSFNLVYPNRALEPVSSPRFATLNLLLPEFVGVFANAERMPEELRQFVLFALGNAKIEQDASKGKKVSNPFFTEDSIVPEPSEKNLDAVFEKLGYRRKAAYEADVEKTVRSAAANAKPPLSAKNRYFASPDDKEIVIGESEEILISGNVPEGISEVYVNNYKLQGYVAGSGKFYYRAKTSIGTMKEGKNEYALSFAGTDGKKVYKETLVVHFVRDAAARETAKAELAAKALVPVAETAPEKSLEEKIAEARAKYAEYDAVSFYSKEGKKFTLNLHYVGVSPEIPELAQTIAKLLSENGISVSVEAVAPEDMNQIVVDGKKDYDLLLTGVNLGLMGYNVFPFFHSGQSETGYNFSKLKNPDLDVLLEELKSKDLDKEGLRNVRERILAILKKDAVVLTFSRPSVPYSIDRGIKNAKIVETLPSSSYLYDILENSYVKEERLADFRSKSLRGFLDWTASYVVSPFR